MTSVAPPRLAAWLLRHAGPANEALAGDLLEEYGRRQSDRWYWRQVLVALAIARSRELLVLLGLLALYRIGRYVTVPGADARALGITATRGSGSMAAFDAITGGNLSWVTLFALGIAPYVTASIVIQAIALAWWGLTRRTATPWELPIVKATWAAGIALSILQATGIALYLERQSIVAVPGWAFRLSTIAIVTAGSVVLMAISDGVTRRGIGNGLFLTFLAAVLAGAPGLVAAGGLQMLTRLVVPLATVALVSHGYRRAFRSVCAQT